MTKDPAAAAIEIEGGELTGREAAPVQVTGVLEQRIRRGEGEIDGPLVQAVVALHAARAG